MKLLLNKIMFLHPVNEQMKRNSTSVPFGVGWSDSFVSFIGKMCNRISFYCNRFPIDQRQPIQSNETPPLDLWSGVECRYYTVLKGRTDRGLAQGGGELGNLVGG